MSSTSRLVATASTLYAAKSGSYFAAWNKEPPCIDKNGKLPKFEAPVVWHDRVVGDVDDVIAHFVAHNVIEKPDRVVLVPLEWAKKGVELGTSTKRKRKSLSRSTELLLGKEWMLPVSREGWTG